MSRITNDEYILMMARGANWPPALVAECLARGRDISTLREENRRLRKACEAALPIVNDRAMGGRMIRSVSEAAEVDRQLRAALAPAKGAD